MTIIIIGAGIMGLSAARSLQKAGHQVTVFDQSTIPNPQGSSFDEHRLIRYPYGRHVGYMRMVANAFDAWDRLWSDLRESFYIETGTLILNNSDTGWAADSLSALREHNHAITEFTIEEVSQRFPFLHFDTDTRASYLESGGMLLASSILAKLKEYLSEHDVSIHEQTAITDIDEQRAVVTTRSGKNYTADLLVVAAGPWTASLLPDLAHLATPSQQTLVYLAPPEDHRAIWSKMPMVLDIDLTSGFYLVPPTSRSGVKIGDHRFSLAGHPDDPREAAEMHIDVILKAAYRRLPTLASYPLHKTNVCFYSVSPDERFVAHHSGNTWVLTGFSGHGFKFGPLIGERFARLVTNQLDEEEFVGWIAGK